MRRTLDQALATPVFPDGVVLKSFGAPHAKALHDLLQLGYAQGGGRVAPFPQWWESLSSDAEYDPALCFTAFGPDGLAGVAQCWSSAFVKDLVVHPLWRRRGLGTALLLTAFHALRQRGAGSVALKVEADNHAALRFYEIMGLERQDGNEKGRGGGPAFS
jgi:ribosomal protein S18 acetylase RimI-like enzyme